MVTKLVNHMIEIYLSHVVSSLWHGMAHDSIWSMFLVPARMHDRWAMFWTQDSVGRRNLVVCHGSEDLFSGFNKVCGVQFCWTS